VSGFRNPLVGGGGALVYPSIHSPNFAHLISGWTINKDGSAEFDNLTIRGTFLGTDWILNAAGEFFYSGTPAPGNLVASIAAAGGTDAFGNVYYQGITTYTDPSGPFLEMVGNEISFGSNAPGSRIVDGGQLTLADALAVGDRPYIIFASPSADIATGDRATLVLYGASANGVGIAQVLFGLGPSSAPVTSAFLEVQGSLSALSALLTAAATGNQALGVDTAGDADARWNVYGDGSLHWGPGSAGTDTNLYRGAANTLRTDDALAFTNLATPSALATASQLYGAAGQLGMVNISGLAENISGSFLSNVSGTSPITTAGTQLISARTIKANDVVTGASYQIHASGTFTTGGIAPTSATFYVYWGGSGGTLLDSIAVVTLNPSLTNAGWAVEAETNFLSTTEAETTLTLKWHTAGGAAGSAQWFAISDVTGITTSSDETYGLNFAWGSAPGSQSLATDVCRIGRVA